MSTRWSGRLYRGARAANDLETIASGDRRRIERRVVNHVKGRALARLGFWRRLWR